MVFYKFSYTGTAFEMLSHLKAGMTVEALVLFFLSHF